MADLDEWELGEVERWLVQAHRSPKMRSRLRRLVAEVKRRRADMEEVDQEVWDHLRWKRKARA